MITFGEFLPEEQRLSFIERHLVPGQILYILTKFPQIQKNKYLLIVCDNGSVASFVINSKIHKFKAKNENLRDCQVCIKNSDYNFLDRDSYVDCTKVHIVERENIVTQILNDTSRVKGPIDVTTKEQIVKAVNKARTLTPEQKVMILEALKSEQSASEPAPVKNPFR